MAKYLITSAQNNTAYHHGFDKIREKFPEHELVICPFTYKVDGLESDAGSKEPIEYAREIREFLNNTSFFIDGISILGNANILPTAKRPLNGWEEVNPSANRVIVPHVKQELKSIPRPVGHGTRIMLSSGCCTVSNYRQRKAGVVAEQYHCIGGVLIDTENDKYPIRHVSYKDGEVFDYEMDKAEALILGDLHADSMAFEDIFELKNTLRSVQAKNLILHDICSFATMSHHNFGQIAHTNAIKNRKAKQDIFDTGKALINISNGFERVYVIRSNHDEHIDKWLHNEKYNWRTDSINASFYLEAARVLVKYTSVNLLEHFLRKTKHFPENVTFVSRQDSLTFSGVECGQHGDKGNNGSRGSINSHNIKGASVTGHSHSAALQNNNVAVVGTCAMSQGYNEQGGGSSWSRTHCVIFENGTIQMLIPAI